MKPMLPTLKSTPPLEKSWVYEVKYDGFRAILDWTEDKLHLWSRNEKDLLPQFPEIKDYLLSIKEQMKQFLPLMMDGELVLLENPYKSNFGQLQIRGRMRSNQTIVTAANKRPCNYLIFDLLTLSGKGYYNESYLKRKQDLKKVMDTLHFSFPNNRTEQALQLIPFEENFATIWDKVKAYDGEGIVAKLKNSRWEEGKRTETWIKFKNWRYVSCFITAYDTANGYYHVGVYHDKEIYNIGLFLFSLEPEEKHALSQVIKANSYENKNGIMYIHPSICVEIEYLEWYENQLREPHFKGFRFDLTPEECTFEKFLINEASLPSEVELTHPDKPLWKKETITKLDFVRYLRIASPFMLPFLKNRLLTVIRYPHGIFGEPFYQKNCPDYAPSFIQTHLHESIRYIVCNDLKTLMWLANQLAIEFHIPFHTIDTPYVGEIVFDLDPPSRNEFHLAVKASLIMKKVFDDLNLISFVKTSGNKGLQVYIPLPEMTFTWEETRLFTEFIANFLISQQPDYFTTERLKKNRHGRLYVDFVQHAEGKTIIAPYSMRGHEDALIATPLFWEEVNEELNPEQFTIPTVLERINKLPSPFSQFFISKRIQPFGPVLNFLKSNS